MSNVRWIDRPRHALLLGVVLPLLAILVARPAAAQGSADTTLAQLDPATRAAVQRIMDSTRAAGLPTTPLEWKVAEGLTKGADGMRIIAAVQRSADGLRRAREALGTAVTTPELIAAAGALQIGASPDVVRRLRAAQPDRPATLRLVVLSDLVSRGVPLADATGALLRLVASGASDADLTTLRRGVLRDVQAGIPPARALSARTRELTPRNRSAAADSVRRPPE